MSMPSEKKPSTRKRMLIMIGLVLLLILVIAGIKGFMIYRLVSGMKPPPPATVSTTKATYQEWQPDLRAVGTLRAARGADLALDIAGLVTRVDVQSGDDVKAGQALLQLRDGEDVAKLHQLEAAAALAAVTFDRASQQLAVKAISKADYDTAAADLKAKQAAVQEQQVNVGKKQLRAPFAGRAGIVTVSPGAYLNSGATILTLQQLDPLLVDFHLPQKNLDALKVEQKVALTLDAFPDRKFEASLSAISPKIDSDTRNVLVEATVANPDKSLIPGMFAKVNVEVGAQQRYLTLPQTAIVYNPYGETVFLVRKKSDFDKGRAEEAAAHADHKPAETKVAAGQGPALPPNTLVVQQAFVTTGATRGDQVAILKGLDAGTEVVTSGQIKLKNGAPITVDNSVQPPDSANPTPQEQ